MDMFAMGLGYVILISVCIFVLIMPLSYRNDEDCFWITYFDIGILVAKSEETIESLSKLRKVKRQRVFINAPHWFNKYVYNFGVRGE